jgi:hypothetical protein
MTAFGTVGLALATFAAVLVSIRLARRQGSRDREVQAHSVEVSTYHFPDQQEADYRAFVTRVTNRSDFTITDVRSWLVTKEFFPCEMHNVSAADVEYDEEGDPLSQLYEPRLDETTVIHSHRDRWFELAWPIAYLDGPYVVVWWRDRWGSRWEYRAGRLGRVRTGWLRRIIVEPSASPERVSKCSIADRVHEQGGKVRSFRSIYRHSPYRRIWIVLYLFPTLRAWLSRRVEREDLLPSDSPDAEPTDR